MEGCSKRLTSLIVILTLLINRVEVTENDLYFGRETTPITVFEVRRTLDEKKATHLD